MYAIIETGGRQYWVSPGDTLQVNRLPDEKGATIELKALWAAEEDKESSRKARVTVEIVRQMRGPKIVVFKKKPKSRYSRKKGHRQELTEIRVKDISLN